MFTTPAALTPLRTELEQITRRHLGNRVHVQIQAVERLRQRLPHQIELTTAVDDATPGAGRFNCFMYGLGLQPPPPLILRIMYVHDVFPSTDFIAGLISRRQLEPADGPVRDGHIVVYSTNETVTHIGSCDGERILSKWGLGHLWRHPLFEVPETYGDTARLFRAVTPETAEQWFITYATERLGRHAIEELRLGT